VYYDGGNRKQTTSSVGSRKEMQYMDESGAILKRLRGKRSLEECAEGIGITARALKSYENNERRPRDDVKVKIAGYYGKSVKYIFFR
jgi:transcriptional regulator with XRE-family HTH domain